MALRSKKSSQSGIRVLLSRFSQATSDHRVILLRYAVIFLMVVTGLFHFRAAFFAQLSQNQGSHIAPFRHSLTDPDALANLAREEHLRNADLRSAQFLYQKALANFGLHLPSWLGIAEVFNDQGKAIEAINVLEFVHNRFSNGEDTAWSKTLLASTLGQEQILTENLLWLITNYASKRKEAFALATITWEEPDVLMNKFGSAFYVDILQEYIRHNELGKTMTVWDTMARSGNIQQKAAFGYVDYLMGQSAFSLASKVWSDAIGLDQPLLYNGNFEKPVQNSGFGWRISSSKGFSWKKGDYGNGLEVSFDGTENAVFQLSQTLPLDPGRYILNGSVETDELTTDQLPFWMIQGVQCIGLSAQSEMVLSNQHPTEFVLPFVVPENCELVRLSLIRRASYHFDNKISGKITLNNLSIQPKEDTTSLSSKSFTLMPGQQNGAQRTAKEKETTISINKLFVRP